MLALTVTAGLEQVLGSLGLLQTCVSCTTTKNTGLIPNSGNPLLRQLLIAVVPREARNVAGIRALGCVRTLTAGPKNAIAEKPVSWVRVWCNCAAYGQNQGLAWERAVHFEIEDDEIRWIRGTAEGAGRKCLGSDIDYARAAATECGSAKRQFRAPEGSTALRSAVV
jgi:hypothetical protein